MQRESITAVEEDDIIHGRGLGWRHALQISSEVIVNSDAERSGLNELSGGDLRLITTTFSELITPLKAHSDTLRR